MGDELSRYCFACSGHGWCGVYRHGHSTRRIVRFHARWRRQSLRPCRCRRFPHDGRVRALRVRERGLPRRLRAEDRQYDRLLGHLGKPGRHLQGRERGRQLALRAESRRHRHLLDQLRSDRWLWLHLPDRHLRVPQCGLRSCLWGQGRRHCRVLGCAVQFRAAVRHIHFRQPGLGRRFCLRGEDRRHPRLLEPMPPTRQYPDPAVGHLRVRQCYW